MINNRNTEQSRITVLDLVLGSIIVFVLVSGVAYVVLARYGIAHETEYSHETQRYDSPVNPASLSAGQYIVESFRWVSVRNPDGIQNGNGFFSYNDTCGIWEGGVLSTVASLESVSLSPEQGVATLVRYTAPEPAFGVRCPSSTVFLIGSTELSGMTDRFIANRTIATRERELIRAILE